MTFLFELQYIVGKFGFWDYVRGACEILVISAGIYQLILMVRRTRAMPILRGVVVLAALLFIAYALQFNTIVFLLQIILIASPITLAIVFHPELRQILENVGQRSFWARRFGSLEKEEVIKLIHMLTTVLEDQAMMKIGTLIVLEQEIKLDEWTRTGTTLDAETTPQLLKTIFYEGTFLHDGAVVIRRNRVSAAGVFLPISDSPELTQDVGSRHRAAQGISEITDAIALVVSEENGSISVAYNGKLIRNLRAEAVRELLYSICFAQGPFQSQMAPQAGGGAR